MEDNRKGQMSVPGRGFWSSDATKKKPSQRLPVAHLFSEAITFEDIVLITQEHR